MKAGGRIFTAMEIATEVGGIRYTCMKVVGSYHGSTWKFPIFMKV